MQIREQELNFHVKITEADFNSCMSHDAYNSCMISVLLTGF